MPTKEHHEQLLLAVDKCCQIASQLPNKGYLGPLALARNAYRFGDITTIRWLCQMMYVVGEARMCGPRVLEMDETRFLFALQACCDISEPEVRSCALMAGMVAVTQYLYGLLVANDTRRLERLSETLEAASPHLAATNLPAAKPANLN